MCGGTTKNDGIAPFEFSVISPPQLHNISSAALRSRFAAPTTVRTVADSGGPVRLSLSPAALEALADCALGAVVLASSLTEIHNYIAECLTKLPAIWYSRVSDWAGRAGLLTSTADVLVVVTF